MIRDFFAARGAAFWLRMRMDWSYRDGFEDGFVSQHEMITERAGAYEL